MTGSPSPAGWQANATINVYIVSNSTTGVFSADQITALQTEFQNWSDSLGANLTYNSTVVTTMPDSPSQPYIKVQYGDVTSLGCSSGASACTFANWSGSPAYVNHANMVVSSGALDGNVRSQLLAHEFGHSYGIDECTGSDCSSSVTLMYGNITTRSHTAPVCCDRKLLYSMSGGSYGQSGECSPNAVQGTAYLDDFTDSNGGEYSTVSATFQQQPSSGNTIIVGCMNIIGDTGGLQVTDNQSDSGATNSYSQLIYQTNNPSTEYAPVAIFKADNVLSTSSPFTVSCSLGDPSWTDVINLFALEYTDVGSTTDAAAGVGGADSSCGTSLTTTSANDLLVGLYNNFTGNNPAGLAPVSPLSTLTCYGGQDGQCAAQNGSIYEVGLLAASVASTSGTYTLEFTGPDAQDSCAAVAIKGIGH